MNQAKDHYGYRVYADPNVAQSFDADRFGGKIGEYVKETQERLLFSVLPDVKGRHIVDVGAGTGRITIPLIERGASVTACDASKQMLDVLATKIRSDRLVIQQGEAQTLQFPDRSFDCAISLRMLMHVVNWRKSLSELCRVSRDWVVVDFPPRRGFLLMAPLVHRIRKSFKSDYQPYATIPMSEIRDVFHKNRYDIVHVDPGFFLPMSVHRLMRSLTLTRLSEKIFQVLGLTYLVGAPITVFARRKK